MSFKIVHSLFFFNLILKIIFIFLCGKFYFSPMVEFMLHKKYKMLINHLYIFNIKKNKTFILFSFSSNRNIKEICKSDILVGFHCLLFISTNKFKKIYISHQRRSWFQIWKYGYTNIIILLINFFFSVSY